MPQSGNVARAQGARNPNICLPIAYRYSLPMRLLANNKR